jgi:hypothetical protein
MPLPILKVEAPSAARPREITLGMLALKVVLSVPTFFGAYALTLIAALDRPILVLYDLALIALGFTIVLSRNFTVGALAFILGSAATMNLLNFMLIVRVFGGHQ